MLKFPKIKLDLYDLASFPGRRFRSPSCGEGPLWALSGLLALKFKRPLSSFTDPNAAVAPAGLEPVRVAVSRHRP
jgi:hypothetical protein